MAHEALEQTLQATASVHEAYIRLVDAEKVQHWDNRGHFFAAVEAMRRILIDNTDHKQRPKHGGDRTHVNLNDEHSGDTAAPFDELLTLNEALDNSRTVENILLAKVNGPLI